MAAWHHMTCECLKIRYTLKWPLTGENDRKKHWDFGMSNFHTNPNMRLLNNAEYIYIYIYIIYLYILYIYIHISHSILVHGWFSHYLSNIQTLWQSSNLPFEICKAKAIQVPKNTTPASGPHGQILSGTMNQVHGLCMERIAMDSPPVE